MITSAALCTARAKPKHTLAWLVSYRPLAKSALFRVQLFPELSSSELSLLRGDGLRGRRHDGSALRDRHGRVDGRRQSYRNAHVQRRAGRRPRGHRDPDRRAVGGLRLDGLAFFGACVESASESGAMRRRDEM